MVLPLKNVQQTQWAAFNFNPNRVVPKGKIKMEDLNVLMASFHKGSTDTPVAGRIELAYFQFQLTITYSNYLEIMMNYNYVMNCSLSVVLIVCLLKSSQSKLHCLISDTNFSVLVLTRACKYKKQSKMISI